MSDHPKISIISTVYNTGPYLRPAVESILAQTFTDFELLLVDDGSHDGSAAVCDALACPAYCEAGAGCKGGFCSWPDE